MAAVEIRSFSLVKAWIVNRGCRLRVRMNDRWNGGGMKTGPLELTPEARILDKIVIA